MVQVEQGYYLSHLQFQRDIQLSLFIHEAWLTPCARIAEIALGPTLEALSAQSILMISIDILSPILGSNV